MNDAELAACHAALGVTRGVSLEELERVFMKKNFALIKGKSGAADEPNPALDAQRQELRAAYEKLSTHLRNQQKQTEASDDLLRPGIHRNISGARLHFGGSGAQKKEGETRAAIQALKEHLTWGRD